MSIAYDIANMQIIYIYKQFQSGHSFKIINKNKKLYLKFFFQFKNENMCAHQLFELDRNYNIMQLLQCIYKQQV